MLKRKERPYILTIALSHQYIWFIYWITRFVLKTFGFVKRISSLGMFFEAVVLGMGIMSHH